MAEQYDALSPDLAEWIGQQHVFFVATAAREGRINLSPKGQDSLRVLNEREILWLNLSGSGNETAAHLLDINRMSLMWCAQYFKLRIDLVQTSCGYAVPFMDFVADRQVLTQWAEKRGPDGIRDYWQEKNRLSIDGLPTGIGEAG